MWKAAWVLARRLNPTTHHSAPRLLRIKRSPPISSCTALRPKAEAAARRQGPLVSYGRGIFLRFTVGAFFGLEYLFVTFVNTRSFHPIILK